MNVDLLRHTQLMIYDNNIIANDMRYIIFMINLNNIYDNKQSDNINNIIIMDIISVY